MSEQLVQPVQTRKSVWKCAPSGAVSWWQWAARRTAAAVVASLSLLATTGEVRAERAVTLAWEPSATAGVTRYYVYALEENSSTPVRLDVGNTNTATIPGLKEGLRYSFNVTAADAQGRESAPSNEALFVVPVPLEMIFAESTDKLFHVRFQGAPGRSYEVQASADLRNWSKMWESGPVAAYGPMDVADPASATLGQRFYRLVVR